MTWLPALMLALTPNEMIDSCSDPELRYNIAPGGIPIERLCTLKGRDAVYLSHAYSILLSHEHRFDDDDYIIEIVEWPGLYQVRFFLNTAIQIDCENQLGALTEIIINYPNSDLHPFEAVEGYEVGVRAIVSEENNLRGQSRYNCPLHYESSPHPLIAQDYEDEYPD